LDSKTYDEEDKELSIKQDGNQSRYNTLDHQDLKTRHKKSPAILNSNFLETIKGFNYSNRHDNSKKIKYPKHESSQNSNVTLNLQLIRLFKALPQ
jgi:hypothetical protein